LNQRNRCKILTIFSNIYSDFKIELDFSSEFELLISVILSAKTTDRMVNKVTKVLFSIANTPSDFISIGVESIKKNIKKIGLFNIKANNIFRTCKILLKKYNGKIPNNRNDLESLPGVGRKTANVILNVLFNKKTIAVDTHVFRFCNRTNFATGKTTLSVEKKLLSVVPDRFKSSCHFWFIAHGRYVCTARVPKCFICHIKHLCMFKYKTYHNNYIV